MNEEDEIKFRVCLLILISEFPTHRKTEAMEELLKIYNKQQKEIEELKKDRYLYNAETGEITKVGSNCVSKDKIREIIKEELPDDEIMETCRIYDVNGVQLREKLEKLLEEK